MNDGVASKTAYRVALRRAVHQVVDRPVVFDDPLAVRIVGEQAVPRMVMEDGGREWAAYFRAFMAVRSRMAEDELVRVVAQDRRGSKGGVQYVVLGAGLDTFGCRNRDAGLRVFEVDHPATQTWKRELLARAEIDVPESLTFTPVDFEKQTAAEGLKAVGFCEDCVTFVSWLGVVPYLSEEAFGQTLRWLGAMPAGSGVVFDYGRDPKGLGMMERMAFGALARRVAAAGEPFRLFREPAALKRELLGVGFGEVEDWDSAAINARYFAGRKDGLCVRGSVGRIVHAGIVG